MKRLITFTALLLILTLILPVISFAGGAVEDTENGGSDVTGNGQECPPHGSPDDTSAGALPEFTGESDADALILIEAETGTVLYEKNADSPLPPASVTKVMTMLLVMEAIDSGRISEGDTVTVSETAASMGGSQVFLEPGETMTVGELLKCVTVASANDASVALAEYISGSEEAFVSLMNKRAAELGMTHTNFENTNGLDDTTVNHVISARDISIMSRELITKHERILEYSSIWMDSIRGGEFGLTNTNRLVRFYPGCTGLKTGSTSKAGFCISVTAEREDLSLICVIMGAESRDVRNAAATTLLDWGFANYGLYTAPSNSADPVPVKGGVKNSCQTTYDAFSRVLPKEKIKNVEKKIELPECVSAPIQKGDKIGEVIYLSEGEEIGRGEILVAETIEKMNFFDILWRMLASFLLI